MILGYEGIESVIDKRRVCVCIDIDIDISFYDLVTMLYCFYLKAW